MSEGFDRIRARELLAQSPLLPILLAEMKADAMATWQNASNTGQREEQWMRLQVMRDFEERINRVLDGAKLEANRAQRADRLKRAER